MKATMRLLPIILAASLSLGLTTLLRADGAAPTPVTVTVSSGPSIAVNPVFLGLSYESSELLPHGGHYYFDASDTALVNLFHTLGIKSLRVGANAVDSPKIAVPQEKDIDSLFAFARAAGVKVIYSFRLKNGDPANSARLARYIADHYADALDCYAIGNEPEFFDRAKPISYPAFLALWKSHFDAILQAVPDAKIEGPSSTKSAFVLSLAHDLHGNPHLKMVTMHYYPFGSGRSAEKDIPGTLKKFLSSVNGAKYEKLYQATAAKLVAGGPAYRIDEMNSCFNGGGKGTSDAYASALWSLDWDHWWVAHRITGINYHTGDLFNMNGGFLGPNYTSFLRNASGTGFDAHAISYAHLAYSLGAVGDQLPAVVAATHGANVTTYAYGSGTGFTVTIINKANGPGADAASVSVSLPASASHGSWQRLDLSQKDTDISAQEGITLGGAPIEVDGTWHGTWNNISGALSGTVTINVMPASATILKFAPTP